MAKDEIKKRKLERAWQLIIIGAITFLGTMGCFDKMCRNKILYIIALLLMIVGWLIFAVGCVKRIIVKYFQ